MLSGKFFGNMHHLHTNKFKTFLFEAFNNFAYQTAVYYAWL